VRYALNLVEEQSTTNKTYLLLTTVPIFGKMCREAAGFDTAFLNENVDFVVLQVRFTNNSSKKERKKESKQARKTERKNEKKEEMPKNIKI